MNNPATPLHTGMQQQHTAVLPQLRTATCTQHGTHLGDAKGTRIYRCIDGGNTQHVPDLAGCHMHCGSSGVPTHEGTREEQRDEAQLEETHDNLCSEERVASRTVIGQALNTQHTVIHTQACKYVDVSTHVQQHDNAYSVYRHIHVHKRDACMYIQYVHVHTYESSP